MTWEQVDRLYAVAVELESSCNCGCWKKVHRVAWEAETELNEAEAEGYYELLREDSPTLMDVLESGV